MALLIEQLKIWQETGGERGGVTRSKGSEEDPIFISYFND